VTLLAGADLIELAEDFDDSADNENTPLKA